MRFTMHAPDYDNELPATARAVNFLLECNSIAGLLAMLASQAPGAAQIRQLLR